MEKEISDKEKETKEFLSLFNKEGKLSDEEIEKIVSFLNKRRDEADKILDEYYRSLLENSKKMILLKGSERRDFKEYIDGLMPSFEKIGSLKDISIIFEFDFRRAMISYYLDNVNYPFSPSALFNIMLLDAYRYFLSKYDNKDDEKNLIDIEMSAKEFISEGKTAEASIYVLSYLSMKLLDIYKEIDDKKEKVENGRRFYEKPGELIEMSLNQIEIHNIKDKEDVNRISKEIYESIKKKGYISNELPPYEELIKLMPNFPDILINSIEKYRDSETKLGVLSVASYYTAIIDFLMRKSINKDNIKDLEEMVTKIMRENYVDQLHHSGISKILYDDVVKIDKEEKERKERDRNILDYS